MGLAAAGATSLVLLAPSSISLAQQNELQQTSPQPPPTSQPAPQQAPSPAPAFTGPTIVLDPAHGGTDTGARGENGAAEKDIVLQIARTVRDELAHQGRRAVLTRSDDSNPSYDDRAALANGYRDMIFISLHASSTGTPGTVRVYFDQFSTPVPPPAPVAGAKLTPAPRSSLVAWQDAQRSYADASHRLADMIQSELAQNFSGSPAASTAAPVRALRSVAAPAVAIELSSVSGSTPDALAGAAGPLANAISRGIASLRQSSPAGAQ